MHIRLAKPGDASAMARLYLQASERNERAFIARLGFRLLRLNYSLLLREPHSIVLCIEDDDEEVLGFISGSTRAEEHFHSLSHHRVRVALASLAALISHPRLIGASTRRYRSMKRSDGSERYVVSSGPRIEFWACARNESLGAYAVDMLKGWLSVARICGCAEVLCEVDAGNTRVLRLHKALGAAIVDQFKREYGIARYILKYTLSSRGADTETPPDNSRLVRKRDAQ
jgi:hypothetical protein